MRYVSLEQVIELQRQIISRSGGLSGVRDMNALKSAVAQPEMTFDGVDLYSSLEQKAAALAHSLTQNHPFVDGNKRVGHAAMEVFLVLNGYEISATVNEQERIFLTLADGRMTRAELAEWIAQNIIEHKNNQPTPSNLIDRS